MQNTMDSTDNTKTKTNTTENTQPTAIRSRRWHKFDEVVMFIMHTILFVVSAALIVLISYDTFQGLTFMTDRLYMRFQFWVCIIFIADYFIEMFFAPDKWRYAWRRLPFLLVSIPYLNLIPYLHLPLSIEHFYLLQFIPLLRAALAISIVFGYFSKNAITSFFVSYIVILIIIGYFGSLIFFEYEHGVNPQVSGYWISLWWAAMNLSTVGCDINPVTVEGRIVAVILPIVGMVIFPLFTVYLTDFVKRLSRSNMK